MNAMIWIRLSVVTCALLSCVGCGHTIQYKVRAEDQWRGPRTDKVVRVIPFSDEVSHFDFDKTEEDDRTWYTNPLSGYKDDEISTALSKMVATHLDESQLFRKVTLNGTTGADYELSGAISRYASKGRLNQGAYYGTLGAAVAGGLAGYGIAMLATSGIKEPWEVEVELRDVQLKDLTSGKVVWQDTIGVSTNAKAYWINAADYGAIYQRADHGLRDVVNEMIRRMAKSGALQQPPPVAKLR